MTTAEGVGFGSPVTADIESEVRRVLDARADRVAALGPPIVEAWDRASSCLLGGKLLRPRLLMGAYDALAPAPFSGFVTEAGPLRPGAAVDGAPTGRVRALRIAAGVELLHFAFLLHDDVIDGDLMRRGRPNFIGLLLEDWQAADAPAAESTSGTSHLQAARSTAMLVGDLLLSSAQQIVLSQVRSGDVGARLLEQFDRAVIESVAGELTDVALTAGLIGADLAGVVEMSRQKTATYSFELPLRSAAILAGHGPEVEGVLGRVGAMLGLSYQLQDDLLSTFGHPADHGKDAYSDLREGKETALIAVARRTAVWPLIEPHFGTGDLSEGDGAKVRSLLSECGAEREIRVLIDDLADNARELVATAPSGIGPDMIVLIDDLIATLDGRRS
jgi:geranylgeranyl diphosphate synthase type II